MPRPERRVPLLAARYELADRPAAGLKMSRGKRVQEGVRAKLPVGVTWDKLAAMSPEDIRDRDLLFLRAL